MKNEPMRMRVPTFIIVRIRDWRKILPAIREITTCAAARMVMVTLNWERENPNSSVMGWINQYRRLSRRFD